MEKSEKKEKGEGERVKRGKQRRKNGNRYTIPQTSLEFCLPCPVHLCTKSDHVRTASEKKQKMRKKSQKKTHHDRTIHHQHDKPSAVQFLAPSKKERPGTDSARARLARQLRKKYRKCHKLDRTQFSPLFKIIKNTSNTCQNRQIHVQNLQKNPLNIWQKRRFIVQN